MHRDQKIGLAFAVLVAGFCGAFCFRNPPPHDAQTLAVGDVAALDARIEQLPVRAYTQREGVAAKADAQPEAVHRTVSARVSLANQVIGFGRPGANEAVVGGDLIDLFPGPPEPVPREEHREPMVIGTTSTPDVSPDSGPLSPRLREDRLVRGLLSEDAASDLERTTDNGQRTVDDLKSVEPPTQEAQPSTRIYVVKSGDTLSSIALREYGKSRRYLDLYRANRDVLADPDDLPVGTTLRIPSTDSIATAGFPPPRE